MSFTDEISQLIDWVDQPAPAVVGETHTLYFTLVNETSAPNLFVGQLFFAPKGSSEANSRFARLIGGGFRLIGPGLESTPAQQAEMEAMGSWVRVTLDLSDSGEAYLEFYAGQPGLPFYTPANPISTIESSIEGVLGPSESSAGLTLDDGWGLTLYPTTAVV